MLHKIIPLLHKSAPLGSALTTTNAIPDEALRQMEAKIPPQ